MESEKILTQRQIETIPDEYYPLAVLSYNYRSLISTSITSITRGNYNHFMWLFRPGYFASQSWYFKEIPVKKYCKNHRLKIWYNPEWTSMKKYIVKTCIRAELCKPKFRTRYDFLAIMGQAIGLTGLQIPWTKICSDHAAYIQRIDKRYILKNPAPSDLNEWFKKTEGYKVFGRFITD